MDLTTALTRLLSDRGLRQAYQRDPEGVARTLSVDKCALAPFVALDPDALETQAQLLVNKRFFEAQRIIPQTFALLGTEARTFFWAYAETQWPEGHTRHMQDAVAFYRYLLPLVRSKVNRSELNRLRFVLEGKQIRIHLLDLTIQGWQKSALQILYRNRQGCPRQFGFSPGLLLAGGKNILGPLLVALPSRSPRSDSGRKQP